MRLVKKTVNQDDVGAYHLFYADGRGSPGTDLTFFDWPVGRERRGGRSITRTALRVAGRGHAGLVGERLAAAGVARGGVAERDGRPTLDLEDLEGQRLSLVGDGGAGEAHPWAGSPVPAERQIRGLGPITISVPELAPTGLVLTGLLGMGRVRDYATPGAGAAARSGRRSTRWAPAGPRPSCTWPSSPACRPPGPGPAGSTTSPSGSRRRLRGLGGPAGAGAGAVQRPGRPLLLPQPLLPRAGRDPVRDRHRWAGVRCRRAGGEPGGELSLPPFLEGRRLEIEAGLKPL
jgi:glyoxalase family protein